MQTQKYRDFTLVFGAPSGGLFDMLSGVSDKTGSPFSEVFFVYLKQFFVANDNPNVIEETLSAMLDADIRVGNLHLDYQYWLEEKPELSKFNQNQNLQNENEKPLIKVPCLMLFPNEFSTASGNTLNLQIEKDHIEYLAAIIGQALKLDWVQTICAHAQYVELDENK